MVESNVTRRRVLQGAGAIGVATLGSTVVSAQEGGGGGDQGTAIRVAHASPDAPNVDVRLTSQDGGGAAGGGNETTGNDTGVGGVNETNETGGQGGDGGTEIGGLGFRDVSSYNEIDPGTYQVEIVPGEGGIQGFIEDIFGGGGDEETVLFDGEIEVEEGTTYTVVAFGEVARGPVPAEDAEMDGGAAGQNETGGELGGNETGGAGQNETGVGIDANETDGVGMDANESDGGVAGQNETGAGQNETGAGAGGTAGQEDQLISELGFGESQTVEVDAGDHSLEVRESGAAGLTGGTDDDTAGNETGVGQNETDGVGMDVNETDGGVAGQNETGGSAAGQNETGGAAAGDTAGQTGGSDRGFQVSVLEDDVSDPGEGTARVRVFHAVPDVDTVSISRISDGAAGQGGAGGNETVAGAGQNETGGAGAGGNDTDGIGGDGGAGQEDGEGGADGPGQDDGVGAGQGDGGAGQQENETVEDGGVEQEDGVRQAQISTSANTVYSGFAVGYFDPQAAATAGDQGGDGGGAGGNDTDGIGSNDTDGMGGDGAGAAQNESDEGLGGGQQGDDGNATGNETGGGDGEQIAEDAEGEEFELVTVEDAQGGERSDGGTGGLLDLAALADD